MNCYTKWNNAYTDGQSYAKTKFEAGGEKSKKEKTMADLYPNLPVLPDAPGRARYRPLADTVDQLRNRCESSPDLAAEINIALEKLPEEVIELNKKMETDPTF